MSKVIELSASAKFGFGGKQYVARIEGRDAKFTFRRTFIGKKSGKRGETTEATVDEVGLYEERDVDSKGRADDSYPMVYEVEGELYRSRLATKEDAMMIAKAYDVSRDDGYRALLLCVVRTSTEYVERRRTDATYMAVASQAAGIAEVESLIERLKKSVVAADDPRMAALAQIRELMSAHGIGAAELT